MPEDSDKVQVQNHKSYVDIHASTSSVPVPIVHDHEEDEHESYECYIFDDSMAN